LEVAKEGRKSLYRQTSPDNSILSHDAYSFYNILKYFALPLPSLPTASQH